MAQLRNSFWAYFEPETDPKFNLNGAMLLLGLLKF